jgi:hypothetical protein
MVTISDVIKMKENGDINGLIISLQDLDIAVRAEAALSLGKLNDQKAVVPLISTLQNDSDPYVRSLAAKSLGVLGDPRARDALMNALANDSLEVSAAASTALGQLEAAAAAGKPVIQESSPAVTTESESKGCAHTFWGVVLAIGILFLLTGVLTLVMFLYSLLGSARVEEWTVVIIMPAVEIGMGILLIFIANRRRGAKKNSRAGNVVSDAPGTKIPDKAVGGQTGKNREKLPGNAGKSTKVEDPNKIGGVDIIWAANKEAVSQLMSLANDAGLDLRGAISTTMGMSGSRDQLVESGNKISLSPARKAWCETTPIYRDNRGGGVYVMFKKLDEDVCSERGLELLGSINPKDYAAALCMANGLDANNLVV